MNFNTHWRHRISLIYIVLCYTWNSNAYSTMQMLGPSDQPEAYFNGSSYIRLQTTISLKRQTGLSFRTCSGGELFSQQHNDNLIELSVNAEGLSFIAKTLGKQFEETIHGNFVNNRWHTVSLQYRLGNLTLEIDGESRLLANNTFRSELLTSPGLYNEGAVLIVGNHYVGCMLEGPYIIFNESFMHNHNVLFEACPIPEDSCNPLQELKQSPSLYYDFCITEPCMRHGKCINGETTYSCECSPRYRGKNCEIDLGNPCDRIPPLCKNGAKCSEDLMGYYSCTCPPNFTGKHCDTELRVHPLCVNNVCLNGGTCQVRDEPSKTECICLPGYTGSKCEINIDECHSAPCKNGGICVDGINNYTCECSHTGYTGTNCEVNVNECLTNPCLNRGTCFDNFGGYLCQCAPGFDGPNCQFSVDECKAQPCQNHGVCVEQSEGYFCRCLPGFIGEHCEIDSRQAKCDECPHFADCIVAESSTKCVCKSEYSGVYPNCSKDPPCQPGICKNGGICIPGMGGYNCSCPPGYTGPACERISCNQNPCKNGGSCVEDLLEAHCACPDGFKGSYCEKRLSCSDSPCLHAVECSDFQNAYICTCEPGWTGANCAEKITITCNEDLCNNGATCLELQHGKFTCLCSAGFTGPRCQINVNDCASMPCQHGGVCIDKVNGFYCNCTDDWMGTICDIPYDICKLKPCQNNGTCVAGQNKHDYSCTCLPGYTGERCQTSTIECKSGYFGDNCSVEMDACYTEPCKNGATCIANGKDSYSCICSDGYKGDTCEEDINECELLGTPICNQGICVNKEGGFQCYCMPGYTGERCNLDFDECLSMPCRNNATCVNKINNYECICPLGYAGKDCNINIDECDPLPCMPGSKCIDGINEFTCICQPGLTGKLCEVNIDDCMSSPCQNGAQCLDGLNSYTCNCTDTGYKGLHCEINIDECAGNPCVNGGECVDEVKNYHCNCHAGYIGKDCEEDVNECESNPCKHSGTCLQKSNMTLYQPHVVSKLNVTLPESFNKPFDYADAAGYECLCIPGITGVNCEKDINECESSPCFSGSCRDGIGHYTCDCDEGYEGEHCDIDIDECERYKPCAHGTCIDRIANYYCDCDPYFGGKNCSVELIGCNDDPCLNGGTCKPYLINENQHRFNCSCQSGFHGVTCEMVTTMSLSGNSSVTVNTTREEGYDIQFRFKTTLGDGILAIGRGSTYYSLELSKGRLNLHTSLLNKWEGVFIGSNLNDSNWQKVFVAINSSHLVLSANDEQTIYPITFNENNNVSSTSFPTTYIGGVPSSLNLRKVTHGQPFLVGCTEDVLINGEWVLPEMQDTSWLEFQDVKVGCHRKPQCDPNPCHSGGHCTDKWRDFSCTCERPYLGHTCQYNYTAATFGYENITDSLVTVELTDTARRAVRNIVDISMFIRTRQPRGQIFYLGSALSSANDETYIAAQLEGGELLMMIHFNGTTEAYTVGGVKLDNGYNHLIQVIRNVTLVQVKLNGTEYFRKTISATGPLDAQVLYLGGQPQLRPVRQATENYSLSKNDVPPSTASAAVTAPLSMVHFKGIIQDVQISNGSKVMVVEFFPLNIDELKIPPSFGNVSFDKNLVLPGVHSDNSCKINPCHHNGICHNTWNDYRCECVRGFKGKDCTEQEFCELEQCPPHSQCRNLEDGYECIANATFDGYEPPLMYSLTILPNSTEELHFDSLELTYRTRSWGTALFAKHLENYFAIFVYHNHVVIEWQTNGNMFTKVFNKDHFEGQWLTVYLEVKEGVLRGGFKEMVLDDSPSFTVEEFDVVNVTEVFLKGTVYVAGSDSKSFDYKRVIKEHNLNSSSYLAYDVTTDMALTSNSVDLPDMATGQEYTVPLYKIDLNKPNDRFKGCLGEIRISKLLLPFFSTSELYPNNRYSEEFFELLSSTKQVIGCVLCRDSDCFNQGQCISPNVTYRCQCPVGFTADDCSVDINECEENQCENNSTCIDEIGRYECKCLPGFIGERCEHEIDECESNPCQNGGTCHDGLAAYTCSCTEDFIGKQCESLKLITCDNQPCKRGATCKDGKNPTTGNNFTCLCAEGMEGVLCDTPYCLMHHCENGYCNTTRANPICQCQHGFEGKFCEINIDDCVLASGKSPCQNGGVCIDGISRYDCNCTGTGYTGLLCENDIDECKTIRTPCGRGTCVNVPGNYKCICEDNKCGHFCAMDDPCNPNPCVNGECESTCTDIPDYICNCQLGFIGKNCTESGVGSSEPDDGLNILYIIIPVVVVVVLAVIIGLAVLFNIGRSKRATRGTYSPSAQEFCNPRVELDHVLKPPPEERLI